MNKTAVLKIKVEFGSYKYEYCDQTDWSKKGIEIDIDKEKRKVRARIPRHGTVLMPYRSIPAKGIAAANFKLWVANRVLIHFNETACFNKFDSIISGDWAEYSRFISSLNLSAELESELDLVVAFLGGDIVPYVEDKNEWTGARLRTPKNYYDFEPDDAPHIKLFNVQREQRRLLKQVKSVKNMSEPKRKFKL